MSYRPKIANVFLYQTGRPIAANAAPLRVNSSGLLNIVQFENEYRMIGLSELIRLGNTREQRDERTSDELAEFL